MVSLWTYADISCTESRDTAVKFEGTEHDVVEEGYRRSFIEFVKLTFGISIDRRFVSASLRAVLFLLRWSRVC